MDRIEMDTKIEHSLPWRLLPPEIQFQDKTEDLTFKIFANINLGRL